MRTILMIAGLVLALAHPALAAGKPWDFVVGPTTTVQPLGVSAKPRSVSLVRAFVDMSEGREWATLYDGGSIGSDVLAWKGSRSDVATTDLAHEFADVLGASGFSDGPKTRLFATDSEAELQVGVVIGNLAARFCAGCGLTTPGDYFKGQVYMTVEWQVFSPLERKVVLTVKTAGAYDAPKSQPGMAHILNGAFRENVRQLLNAGEFRALMASAPGAVAASSANPAALAPLALAGAAAKPRPIPEAMKSVVAVFANSGMGSGFLVSEDGCILTNQHVVGDAKFVKVKWSDGAESLGEVLRSDRRRDVALVKTEPRPHRVLALRTDAPPPLGETVWAIGTPLDEKYQNTLTKGIVSGHRTLEGLTYIQSDVATDHGNSGGPLLDEQGRVVAVAVARDERDGVGHDINFFIPIEDALRALGLIVRAPPATAANGAAR
ncbi:trypsin-like peptidase domain-containing protein [uncultured Phenylobacterium sp.]|uniref:S1C family serine protease n=1 Tax=uncultured Phenylobacterium sp. TaxID=349273 RepID=UPI0025EE2989|nr:trypsin-like peptidase domain-containing protein [uncultured Phenylobacterium sp.]